MSVELYINSKKLCMDILLFEPGTGEPLSIERTRMLLALRINILAKGYR